MLSLTAVTKQPACIEEILTYIHVHIIHTCVRVCLDLLFISASTLMHVPQNTQATDDYGGFRVCSRTRATQSCYRPKHEKLIIKKRELEKQIQKTMDGNKIDKKMCRTVRTGTKNNTNTHASCTSRAANACQSLDVSLLPRAAVSACSCLAACK